ncbi:hypothetical protein [Streptomyces sp. NPDC058335]|uniref:hypothetical protein n=1 Tax=Streptomyces sp. NPDC058335 TaxID=3346451 RepID=UPI003667A7FD
MGPAPVEHDEVSHRARGVVNGLGEHAGSGSFALDAPGTALLDPGELLTSLGGLVQRLADHGPSAPASAGHLSPVKT